MFMNERKQITVAQAIEMADTIMLEAELNRRLAAETEARRDDTGLIALVCPHCKQTVSGCFPQCFATQQLIGCRCDHCDAWITTDEISETYREYRQ